MERVLGANHPETLTAPNDLANAHQAVRRRLPWRSPSRMRQPVGRASPRRSVDDLAGADYGAAARPERLGRHPSLIDRRLRCGLLPLRATAAERQHLLPFGGRLARTCSKDLPGCPHT